MQTIPLLSSILVSLLLSTSALAAGDDYECGVVDMTSFDADEDFRAKNLRKRFLIKVDDERIYVTSLSDSFENSQEVLRIFKRGGLTKDVYGISETSIGVTTIALSENPFN
ncbi:hypothetical protein [Ruegeria sp. Ofav3-42]|uniref:hypothetical protein n=1 Tax=Ruegeria sp. Ofav3-42 TaxID=2917759 RepID=UPI001EF6216F|nr:hypothetical protein [Ruegeria sp. Ofav3-42]MCG7518948.1 hypothetical protein [Ruegeria sp. Ofav3-42]